MRRLIVRGLAKWFGVTDVLSSGMWKDMTGPTAKTLTIKYKVPGPVAELWLEQLDGEKQFGKLRPVNGVANAGVLPGQYSLNARGKTTVPSSEYALEVTGPSTAVMKPNPAPRSDESASFDDLFPVTV